MPNKNSNVLALTAIFAAVLLIITQAGDVYNKGELVVICKQFGYARQNPWPVVGWLLVIFSAHYVILNNPKLENYHVKVSLIILVLLILASNIDYETRKNSDQAQTLSAPHYVLAVGTFVTLIFLLSRIYNKQVVIPIVLMFLLFMLFNLMSMSNRKKYKKEIIYLETFIINAIIFLLLLDTVMDDKGYW
jgi:FtsH-binding integral membrane protein